MEDQNEKPNDVTPVASDVLLADHVAKWLECLIEHMEERHWTPLGIVQSPKGDRQESEHPLFDHEYVDTSRTFEDDYHGHMYFPLGDQMGGYLKIYIIS